MANRNRSALMAWLWLVVCLPACAGPPAPAPDPVEPAGSRTEPTPIPVEPPSVRTYVVHRAGQAPELDGRLEAAEWEGVAWTSPFLDIEGTRRPSPPVETRVRMAWDDTALYVGAALEEPHLQASLLKRDTIIYLDNDFEVFIDPDGDTHNYFELEINTLGTEWDLRLSRPYRDGGQAEDAWDIAGLRTAISLDGTLNDPADRDGGWSIEIAIPFASLDLDPPRDGDQWRVNFSRVEWTFDVDGGAYTKRLDPATGRSLPESNWVWSPQFAVNMHMPEMWGIVQFSAAPPGDDAVAVPVLEGAGAQWSLRRVYYAQRSYRRERGVWAEDLEALGLAGLPGDLVLEVPSTGQSAPGEAWHAWVGGEDGAEWWIRADGRIWRQGGERP